MKKNTISVLMTLVGVYCSVICISCKKDYNNEPKLIVKDKITGYIQKGPFVNGTSISISELTTTIEQTGKNYNTQIENDFGLFNINNIKLISNFIELSSSGYYFNENSGNISNSPLTLYCISDITNVNNINLNILTHLERQRARYLFINSNLSLNISKDSAQSEIIKSFGFKYQNMKSSENLDITVNEESNAVLIAISIIIQGSNNVGELTELLSKISLDLKEDGIIDSKNTLDILREFALKLKMKDIRNNLENRYKILGIPCNIPNFEKYVNDFLSFTAQKPIAITLDPEYIETSQVTLKSHINPNSSTTKIHFEYGLTTDYGNQKLVTPDTITSNSFEVVMAVIDNLEPGTLYNCRVVAENEKGISYGENITFTTLGSIPNVINIKTSNIKNTSITFTGIVNPNYLTSTVSFEYGTTTDYGTIVQAIPNAISGNSNQTIIANVSDLSAGTVYHYRLVSKNELGNSNSIDDIFKTSSNGIEGTVSDYEGNIYKTIGIGNQIWMSENLKSTIFNDGTIIPNTKSNEEWNQLDYPSYCFYDNEVSLYKDKYGALYNWYAVNDERICPGGWHIPSIEEWEELINYVKEDNNNGTEATALKATYDWGKYYLAVNGTDKYGFSALPGGFRNFDGRFWKQGAQGLSGWWWTNTEASNSQSYYIEINDIDQFITELDSDGEPKTGGRSIRCVKDK